MSAISALHIYFGDFAANHRNHHQTFQISSYILKQNPDSASAGGFQNFLVKLGYRVDDDSGELELDNDDLNKINRYATQYGGGGYESRMFKIFGRTLGEHLGWPEKYKRYLK